jgi:hypothetical protein
MQVVVTIAEPSALQLATVIASTQLEEPGVQVHAVQLPATHD